MGRAFFHCSNCDVRYLYPELTAEEAAAFYAAEFEGFMAGRAGSAGGWSNVEQHIQANEPNRLRRMAYLSGYLSPGSKLLEVGCSSGFMLFPLMELGHDCTGVEPSGIFQSIPARAGHAGMHLAGSIISIRESAIRSDSAFLRARTHCLEPGNFSSASSALLRPGGKIVFEIPNAADPLYSVYEIPAFERFYWSVAHPWYFSEASLRYLLDQLGRPYEILRDQRYDLSNHMVWARDGRPGGMGRFGKLLGAELEESYKKALIRIGRCDTLIGIVRNI